MKVILKYRGNTKILIYEIEDRVDHVFVTIKHKHGNNTKIILSYFIKLYLKNAIKQIKKMISDTYVLEYEKIKQ